MDDPMQPRRYLFVLHEASRSGAPVIALSFIRWLHRNTNHGIEIILMKGGELEKDFQEMRRSPVYPVGIPAPPPAASARNAAAVSASSLSSQSEEVAAIPSFFDPEKQVRMPAAFNWIFPRLRVRILNGIRTNRHRFMIFVAQKKEQHRTRREERIEKIEAKKLRNAELKKERNEELRRQRLQRLVIYDCVVCTSLHAAPGVPPHIKAVTPVLLWLHELEFAMATPFPIAYIRDFLFETALVVACAECVAHNVIENHGYPADRVVTVPDFIEPLAVRPTESRMQMAMMAGIPTDAHIVMATAWLQWRKGPDLFLRMAERLPTHINGREVHCIWIGGDMIYGLLDEYRRRSEAAGVGHRLHFLGHRSDAHAFMAECDVFVVPSREDPHPIVMVEAALLKRPIVAFRASGGAEEFLRDGRGVLVPYQDVNALTEAVESLLKNPDRAKAMGRLAYDHAAEGYLIEHAGPRMYEALLRASRDRGQAV